MVKTKWKQEMSTPSSRYKKMKKSSIIELQKGYISERAMKKFT